MTTKRKTKAKTAAKKKAVFVPVVHLSVRPDPTGPFVPACGAGGTVEKMPPLSEPVTCAECRDLESQGAFYLLKEETD